MKIHRLTHVGFVVPDIEAAVTRWEELFDLKRDLPRPTWLAGKEHVHATMMPVTGGGIEPLQPSGAPSDFLAALASGRGPYHVSFRVSSIVAVAQRLWDHDLMIRLRPPDKIVNLHRIWIDPSSACGAHIEMIDREERSGISGEVVDDSPPLVRGNGIERLAGAFHIADDLEAAARLYGGALGFKQDPGGVVAFPEEGVERVRFTVGDGELGDGEAGPMVEVVRVIDAESPLGRIKARNGCGIGAWTFEVTNLDDTLLRLAAQDCWLRLRPATDRLPRRIWVDPRSTSGVPLLLVERGMGSGNTIVEGAEGSSPVLSNRSLVAWVRTGFRRGRSKRAVQRSFSSGTGAL